MNAGPPEKSGGPAFWRILGTIPPLPPQDCFCPDRVHWEDAYPDHNLSPFVRACIYNTVNHRPQEHERFSSDMNTTG
jgi:hypothetical protein